MLHVGVDLHKRFSQLAILDQGGAVTQRRVEHTGTEMEEFLRGLEPASRIAVEATGNWYWFVDQAQASLYPRHGQSAPVAASDRL